jgi:hypothetical protein
MLEEVIFQHYRVAICRRMLSIVARLRLFAHPEYCRRVCTIPFNDEYKGLRKVSLQQELEEFYEIIEGMQYKQHMINYLFKKRLM